MRIVLDAMGSDTHPEPELRAAIEAFQRWNDPIFLTGPEELLNAKLSTMNVERDAVHIIHAPEVLGMEDKPAQSAKGKAKSSMAIGIQMLKDGQADAFVTAGNTGGVMANALLRLGRIRGLKRPALATVFPVRGGHAIIIDLGANADCRPINLLQFAILGSEYAKLIFQKQNPRVALVSNGEEAGKGNRLVSETFPEMEALDLNFIGNIEPKDLFAGVADVAVTDGFTGNILIKTTEAAARFLFEIIRSEIKSTVITSLGGLLARPAFKRINARLDPAVYGAAPLLGVKGLVFVGHGRSGSNALVNAIRVARDAVKGNLLEALVVSLENQLSFSNNMEEVH